MSETTPESRLTYLELEALAADQSRRARLSLLSFATVASAGFAASALMLRAPHARVIAAAWVVATVAGWVWHLAREEGAEGRRAKAWRAWLRAGSWFEASQSLIEIFRTWHPPTSSGVIAARDLSELVAVAFDHPDEAHVGGAVRRLLEAELEARTAQAELDAKLSTERLATLLHEREEARRKVVEDALKEAMTERERILREALEDADDIRAGRPPRHAQWTHVPERADALRRAFEQAAQDASSGAAMESPAATEVLKSQGRWSPGLTRQTLLDSLVGLYAPPPVMGPPPPDEPQK